MPTSQPPPAATTPTPSAAAQAAADEEGVRSALRAYEQAYSSLKVEAVLEVYPDVNAAQLKRSFDDLREQQVSIACDQIAVSGVNANATCQVRTSILPRAGSRRTQMFRSFSDCRKSATAGLSSSDVEPDGCRNWSPVRLRTRSRSR